VTLTGVDPVAIANNAAATLTVSGSGFENGAVVVLQGYSTLQTVFVSSTLLQAVVPAGVPGEINGRLYDVIVFNPTNPQTNCAALPGALTVFRPAPTATPGPTSTPAPTAYVRPTLTVQSYGASSTTLSPGQDIDFEMTLQNLGQVTAANVIVTFVPGDLMPRATGGVQALGDIAAGASLRFFQPFRVSSSLWSYEADLQVKVSYTDAYGKPYEETFTLTFPVSLPSSTATPTPTLSTRPNVSIVGHETEPSVLTPGSTVALDLNLVNVGPQTARLITIRMNIPTANQSSLASLSSNERYVDQLGPGESTAVHYDLAVSGDAGAGLIPITFELSYTDSTNAQVSEVESLSLRVDSVPFLYVSLFSDVPETITLGDTFELPIQVINIGSNSVNVNTVEVVSDKLAISDGLSFLGELDAGTSGSLVANAQAVEAGTATVWVHVNYLDAFQQPQVYTQEMTFEVQGIATPEPSAESPTSAGSLQFQGEAREMTLWERIVQALLGFLGLAVQG
jgi:uncharacterized repeat protein (TIGR01451 family)